MGLVLFLVAWVLLLLQWLLIARAILDWSTVLAGPAMPGSVRGRLLSAVTSLTEPILGPVRRVVPPLRLGSISLDTSFILVFIAVIVLRGIVGSLQPAQ